MADSYDPSNILAKILRGELPCHKVFEDGSTLAFMDIMPRCDGHCLVIPKSPVRTILDIAPDDLASLARGVQVVARAAVSAMGADGLTVQQFNEAAGGAGDLPSALSRPATPDRRTAAAAGRPDGRSRPAPRAGRGHQRRTDALTRSTASMYLGIDIGTSAVKIVLVDDRQAIVADAEERLQPRQPQSLWSEDDPEAWWLAVTRGLDRLAGSHREAMGRVRAIGLSGQMHGAVLLDRDDVPVRPAILWNDGRASAQADALAALGTDLQKTLGVRPMPGLTGPKIMWLRGNEPEALERTRHLLLPKDYVRLRLTGGYATDVSDAAGTWLLDQATRRWSPRAIEVCGVDPSWLPGLHESTDVAGTVRPQIAARWGLSPVPVAGGGGDSAVGGIGIGAIEEGQGFVSLGTSGQVFLAARHHSPDPGRMVHAFCHAVPDRWCRMAALLNGASPLAAVARWTGEADIGALLAAVEERFRGPSDLLALPYLFGERTPHNDPHARGAIVGLTAATRATDIAQAVLEGVAFSLADGYDVLSPEGSPATQLGFIGGGARSILWGRIIASVLGVTLVRYDAAERGPAFGAARLGRLCATGEPVDAVVIPPKVERLIEPDLRLQESYRGRLALFRSLYQALRPIYAATAP